MTAGETIPTPQPIVDQLTGFFRKEGAPPLVIDQFLKIIRAEVVRVETIDDLDEGVVLDVDVPWTYVVYDVHGEQMMAVPMLVGRHEIGVSLREGAAPGPPPLPVTVMQVKLTMQGHALPKGLVFLIE